MITREEIAKMSVEERREAIELLQASLEEREPSWLAPLLAKRRADLEGGQARTFSLDEIEERFRQRRA